MKTILMFLSGKKGVIASILMTVAGFLGTKGILDGDTVIFIGAIVAIIFGTASAVTKSIVYEE